MVQRTGKSGASTSARKQGANFHSKDASTGKLGLQETAGWANADKGPLDPNLRIAHSVLGLGDPNLVFQRLGIKLSSSRRATTYALPVHVTLTKRPDQGAFDQLAEHGLTVPDAYLREVQRNPALRSLAGTLRVQARGGIDVEALRTSMLSVLNSSIVSDFRLASRLLPCDAGPARETHGDFGLPADRTLVIDGENFTADGSGTIIGIIDDGCALANWNFLRDGPVSRIVYLWDQGRRTGNGSWSPVDLEPTLGYELRNVAGAGATPIDAALAAHTNANGVINEDGVYAALGYWPLSTLEGRRFIPASHGTHVMDVAAGNGRALFGNVGVASEAAIIFVQLPPELVAEGGVALSRCIQLGAHYIFDRAAQLASESGKRIPVSVNISFGGYSGSHDGLMDVEKGLDQLLAVPDRAIVVAAGNGYAARCHAQGTISNVQGRTLRWQVQPFDESVNRVEFWYTGPSEIDFYLTPPDMPELGPVKAGTRHDVVDNKGNVAGYVEHIPDPQGDRNLIVVDLNPTLFVPDTTAIPFPVAAPAGTWRLRLTKGKPGVPNDFHAWIERDEMRSHTQKQRRQSRFHDDDCHPGSTVTGLATGFDTIAVGGYVVATSEVAEYSACGPARPSPSAPARRSKPEICAPAAHDALGAGVSSTGARFALRTRMGGTSVAAPHVAGLAALVQQINMDLGNAPLATADLRRLLLEGAANAMQGDPQRALKPNRHQAADPTQRLKQKAMLPDLTGGGRAHAWQTLLLLK